jgi:photosystem II stability/assembly factor-like uncharacterized protein
MRDILKSFRIGLFHLLLVSTLLLPACSSGKSASRPTASLDQSGTSAGPTTPSTSEHPKTTNPSSSDSPAKPAKVQIQTRLADFQFLDDQIGYAWGVTGKELKLYQTTDGGKTWANTSTSVKQVFTVSPEYGRTLFFYDKQNGWIVRDELNGEKPVILHTINGGETWNPSAFPDQTHVAAIQFIDAKTGWLLCSAESGMSHSEKSLYMTTDGGATWQKIMQNTGYIQAKNPTKDAIPQTGYVTGISFQDARNGWVTLNGPAGASLYRTQNGGAAWSKVPVIAKGKQDEFTLTWNPLFFGTDKNTGWFPVAYEQPKQIQYHGYFTADGGEHWKETLFGVRPVHQMTEKAPFTFVSLSDGWYVNQNQVYHTADGGKTWTLLKQDPVLTKTVKQYPQIAEIQFTSKSTGWLLLQTEDHKKSLLLKTENGGQSWNII